jgi:hypothetical protein
MSGVTLSTARDAWQLLRGVACVYKPPGCAIASLQKTIKVQMLPGISSSVFLPISVIFPSLGKIILALE